MSQGAALVFLVWASIGWSGSEPPTPAEDLPALHVRLADRPKEDVQGAVTGAMRRLGQQQCAALLDEMRARDGLPLSSHLQATGLGAREYLASLRFLDGTDEDRCHADSTTVAFTQPGSRVVYICSQRFSALPRNSITADVTILHEFLHSLGLGEDPPSPGAISRTVQEHCRARQ
jgi:hypothetical protein